MFNLFNEESESTATNAMRDLPNPADYAIGSPESRAAARLLGERRATEAEKNTLVVRVVDMNGNLIQPEIRLQRHGAWKRRNRADTERR